MRNKNLLNEIIVGTILYIREFRLLKNFSVVLINMLILMINFDESF